jgi:hypothetical protein
MSIFAGPISPFFVKKVDIRQFFSTILTVFSTCENFWPLEIMQPVASWTLAGCINQGHACRLGNAPQLIGLRVA